MSGLANCKSQTEGERNGLGGKKEMSWHQGLFELFSAFIMAHKEKAHCWPHEAGNGSGTTSCL